MITLTYTFASEAELVAHLAGKATAPVAESRPTNADLAAAKAKPAKAEPKPEPVAEAKSEPVVEPQAAAAEEPAAAPAADSADQKVERATVSQAIVQLAVKDKAKAIEILASFGVKAGKELTDDQLAPCYAKVQEALGA